MILRRLILALLAAFSVTPAIAATTVLQPGGLFSGTGKDTQLVSGFPYSTIGFGSGPYLHSGYGEDFRIIALVEFNLSSIPSNAVVHSAELSLFHEWNSVPGERYDAFRVTSFWTESTSYAGRPTFDPAAVASLTIPDEINGVSRSWHLTPLVRTWVAGTAPNYGLGIEHVPSTGYGVAFFSSSEVADSSRWPKLTVEWSVPETAAGSMLFVALAALAVVRRRATCFSANGMQP